MLALPHLKSQRTTLKLLEPYNAELMLRFRIENRAHLKPWEPRRPAEFFTRGFWELQLRHAIQDFEDQKSCCFAIMDSQESEVLGVCNYTSILRGTFMACYLGYALSAAHEGKGLMREALLKANAYVFDSLGLHRIMANYMPSNERSAHVLDRLGFTREGLAKDYLKIDGRWEDHILTSLINPAG
jgi:ribosomal-protein-alanine N-acetyltransferase